MNKEKRFSNLFLINYPPKYPKTVHLYITNECNLNCEKCHYRNSSDPKEEISFNTIKGLFKEWKQYGLTSIAIGGGEPLLHPSITEIVDLGREMGFFMAVTTNGTELKEIKPNRIHISYDTLHPTWKNERLIQKAIDHYKSLECKVGINHIIKNLPDLEYIKTKFKNIDNILLIREKPDGSFTQWSEIPRSGEYWIEGCIEGSRCEQGILSFYLNYDLKASICSNFERKIPYSNLEETWEQLKSFKCKIRDLNVPKLF